MAIIFQVVYWNLRPRLERGSDLSVPYRAYATNSFPKVLLELQRQSPDAKIEHQLLACERLFRETLIMADEIHIKSYNVQLNYRNRAVN